MCCGPWPSSFTILTPTRHLNVWAASWVVATRLFCDQAEMFRAMRSQLLSHVFKADGHPKPALAVVSPEAGDGKSYFAANIAVAFSQLGGRSLAD